MKINIEYTLRGTVSVDVAQEVLDKKLQNNLDFTELMDGLSDEELFEGIECYGGLDTGYQIDADAIEIRRVYREKDQQILWKED